MKPLDFEIIEDDPDDWQVWVSGEAGACVGSGKTRFEAAMNAVQVLTRTAATIADTALQMTEQSGK